jgi:MscS family membrane protein
VEGFFERTYYGNTVLNWLTTFLIILAVIIGGRAIYWVISRFLKRAAHRSRIRLDELLIDGLEEPISLLLILIGSRIAITRLTLDSAWVNFVDGALGIAYALVIAWLLTRIYDSIHKTYLVPLANKTSGAFDDQVLPLIRRGLKIIIWTLAIIIGLNNAGYNVGTVLAGLGIGGLAFALAAQDTVGNIFGGITIVGQKPFLIGDLIEFEGKQYVVKEIGWRATTAEDWNTGYRVTIPNSKFTGGIIANVSAERGYWFEETVRLAADLPVAKIEQAIQDIKDSVCCHPNIDGHKVRFEGFGSGGYEMLVLFHVASFDHRWQVITDANLDLLRRFEEHGIRIAAPMHVNVNAPLVAASIPAPAQPPAGAQNGDETMAENKVVAAAVTEVAPAAAE